MRNTSPELNMADEDNFYEILEVTQENSTKEITKAYRKKALKCHPDKNPDNPAAAELFLKLSKALEVLLDPKARAAYDAVLKSKERIKLRNKALDAKRKKFKQDLEQQENNAKDEKENDEVAAKRLQAEIERLREEGSRLLQEQQEALQEQLKKEKEQKMNNRSEEITARLRVKWKCIKSDESNNGYSKEVLSQLLSKFGEVNHVIVSAKKKGSAVVEFKSFESAKRAVQSEIGLAGNPLKLIWIDEPPSQVQSHQPANQASSQAVSVEGVPVQGVPVQGVPVQCDNGRTWTSYSPSFSCPSTQATSEAVQSSFLGSMTMNKDYESITLMRMRQAQERKRLIEEMQKEDAENQDVES